MSKAFNFFFNASYCRFTKEKDGHLKKEAWHWGRSLQQHTHFLVRDLWWLVPTTRAPGNLSVISMEFSLILGIKMAQPGRSLNVGCSWPGVFLPGASGHTRRFFTQLLFHNPHSFSLMEAINSVTFFWVCVPQLFKQVLPYPLVVRLFWVIQFFGSWIFWVLCFQGLRFHGYKSFSS